ncbi:DNA-directed DNA polymerase alpha catalytic [Salix suchowensis]|nr:DNA-directed DNA polymerase alpha catalytic [Salix suchowensis]
MDFNSLYPSIIQEYNIDFTTVDENAETEVDLRYNQSKNEDGVPEPPPPGTAQGVLPRLIATLVNRRRQVKALMKDRNVPQHKRVQYDIKQMALKLTANSMYGCLGFEHSRFYAKPLAALTTHMGREILMQTKALAENLGLEVVYGDTDSIFVNSNETEYEKAIAISFQLKRAVNDKYKLLEIDLDSVFERLLLLQKKKYAALKVEDKTEGTDRDCGREDPRIPHNNGENIRGGRVKVDDFIIFKRLGKNPDDYNDATAKTLPHVHVAKKMKSKGGSARMGDVIPYIFCREIGDVDDNPSTSQAERAKHPDDLRKDESTLIIDHEYYIAHQILPPIQRLCEYIEGTDKARLAESLDPDGEGGMDAAFSPLDAQISDQERYKDATPFMVKCRGCKGQVAYAPMYERSVRASILQPAGPSCPACSFAFSIPSLLCQLEHQIRTHISKYYEGWLVCDDPTCDNRTRMMSVYGKRCLRSGCRGNVGFEVCHRIFFKPCGLADLSDSTPMLLCIINFDTTLSSSIRRKLSKQHRRVSSKHDRRTKKPCRYQCRVPIHHGRSRREIS